MLALTGACLYARLVICQTNPDLQRVMGLIRARRELRWAWLVEGGALVRRPDRPRAPGDRTPAARGVGRAIDQLSARPARRAAARRDRAGAARRRARRTRGRAAVPAAAADRRPGGAGAGVRRRQRQGARAALAHAAPGRRRGPADARADRRRRSAQRASRKTIHSSTAPTASAASSPASSRQADVTARDGELVLDHRGGEQRLPRDVDARRRHHHVPRTGREHVGHVEPRGPSQQARHPLLQQQRLDELALGLVVGPGDLRQPALGQLRLDQTGAATGLGDGLSGDRRP